MATGMSNLLSFANGIGNMIDPPDPSRNPNNMGTLGQLSAYANGGDSATNYSRLQALAALADQAKDPSNGLSPSDIYKQVDAITANPQDIANRQAVQNYIRQNPNGNLQGMGTSLAGQTGDMTTMMKLPDIIAKVAEANKNNAQAGEANAAARKSSWEMGGAPAGGTDGGSGGGFSTPGGIGASSIPAGTAQPINAYDLTAPTAPNGQIPPPPSGIQLSGNNPNMPTQPSMPQQPQLGGQAAQQAALEATKAKNAEILAAQKGVQQILSRLPSMKAKLQQMNDVAPNTISGMGVNPPQDSNETYGLKGQLMEQFPSTLDKSDKIGATSVFKNLNDQLFVNEIPALMNGASGMRMDIPLVKGVKSASGVPIDLPPKDKQQVIQTLNDNFDQTRDNALSYYKNLTGQDYDMGTAFQTPAQIRQAVQTGVINADQAKKILRDHFGAVQKGQ